MRVVGNVLHGRYRLEIWVEKRTVGGVDWYGCDVLPLGSNVPIHTIPSISPRVSAAIKRGHDWIRRNR